MYLGVSRQSKLEPRCRRRRQQRALHQSFLHPELLDRSRRQDQDDLDSRRQADSQGTRAGLRLQHRRGQSDSLPVPAELQDQAMKWVGGAAATLLCALAVSLLRADASTVVLSATAAT